MRTGALSRLAVRAGTTVRTAAPSPVRLLHFLNSVPPSPPFAITTRDAFTEHVIVREIGIVVASDARTKNILKDVLAAFTHIFGGETTYYSHLLSETTEAATDKLVTHARSIGATGIVNLRYQTTTTMNRLVFGMHATVLVYGTAVHIAPRGSSPRTF